MSAGSTWARNSSMPSFSQTARAAVSWSPVSMITRRMPSARRAAMAWAASGRGGSLRKSAPASFPPMAR